MESTAQECGTPITVVRVMRKGAREGEMEDDLDDRVGTVQRTRGRDQGD